MIRLLCVLIGSLTTGALAQGVTTTPVVPGVDGSSSSVGLYKEMLTRAKQANGTVARDWEEPILDYIDAIFPPGDEQERDLGSIIVGDYGEVCTGGIDQSACQGRTEVFQTLGRKISRLNDLGRSLQAIATGHELAVIGYPGQPEVIGLRFPAIQRLWAVTEQEEGQSSSVPGGNPPQQQGEDDLPVIRIEPIDMEKMEDALNGVQEALEQLDSEQRPAAIWRYRQGHDILGPDCSEETDGSPLQYVRARFCAVEDALKELVTAANDNRLHAGDRGEEDVLFPSAEIETAEGVVTVWMRSDDAGLVYSIPIDPVRLSLRCESADASPACDTDKGVILGGLYPDPPQNPSVRGAQGSEPTLIEQICDYDLNALGYLCRPPDSEECEEQESDSGNRIILTACHPSRESEGDALPSSPENRSPGEAATGNGSSSSVPGGSSSSAGRDDTAPKEEESICNDDRWEYETEGDCEDLCDPTCRVTYDNTIGNHFCYAYRCTRLAARKHRLIPGRIPYFVMDEAYPWDVCIDKVPDDSAILKAPPRYLTQIPPYDPEGLVRDLSTALCRVNALPWQIPPELCAFDTRYVLESARGEYLDNALPSRDQKREIRTPMKGLESMLGSIGASLASDQYRRYFETGGRGLASLAWLATTLFDALGETSFPQTMCPRNAMVVLESMQDSTDDRTDFCSELRGESDSSSSSGS